MRLFCDCKTDEEKSNFFLSGMAVETGVIAPAISNDVAMAYHRCAQFKKENDELRARIEAMEKQEPVVVGYLDVGEGGYLDIGTDLTDDQIRERLGVGKHNLYAAPVDAKAIRAEALKEAEEIAKTIGGSFADEFLAATRELK